MKSVAKLPYLLLVLASLAAAPVFASGLPCSDDTLPHFYRAVQLDVLLRQGAPFLQWGPDLLRGYGYPIFAFYAPLAYWLIELFHLAGLDFGPALQVVFFLTLPLAAAGAYHLTRRYLGVPGAFVAGLAYLFAPYLLYDAIQRGALPETLALALLPWAVAAAEDARRQRTIRATARAAVLFSLLILTHNVIPLFGLGLALVLGVGGWGLGARSKRQVAGGRWQVLTFHVSRFTFHISHFILALALTAGFWLPILVELPYTQSRRPDPPFHDWPLVEQHLLPLSALVEWPADPPDPNLLNPPTSRTLGPAQAVLAAMGMVRLAWRRRTGDDRRPIANRQNLPPATGHRPPASYRRSLILWALMTLAAVFFASKLSDWWWGNLPPLNFIQLPTRFLGPASLGVAILAGAATDAPLRNDERGRMKDERKKHSSFILHPSSFALVLPALAVSISGWPWLYPAHCPVPERPDQVALAQATVWDRWFAEAQGEVLPRWVDVLPPEDGLTAQYLAGTPVNRLSLPAGGQIVAWTSAPGRDQYTVNLPVPATVVYQSFYFPGWRVRLDGRPLPIHITHREGLIAFDLPAGQHTLEVAFGRTPIRVISLIVSGLAAGLILLAWRRAMRDEGRKTKDGRQPSSVFRPSSFVPLTLTLTLMLTLKFALVDRLFTPLYADRFHDGQLSGLSQPAAVSFSGEFLYLGYEGPEAVKSGAAFELTQYWAPQREIGVPYWFAVQIADDAGNVWNRPPQQPFGYAGYPSPSGWVVGGYARDAYWLTLLPGTPPGEYWIEAWAFRADVDLALIPLGAPTGPDPAHARVGRLRVTPGALEVDADNAAVDTYAPHTIPAAPGLSLLGGSLSGVTLRPGDRAHVELLWQAVNSEQLPMTNDPLPVTLLLANEEGAIVVRHPLAPGGSGYPMAQWPAGALVRDQLNVRLPAALPSGRYEARVEVAGDESLNLGFLQVDAPERVFSPPPVATAVGVEWQFARLVGYTLSDKVIQPGQSVNLDLLWQAVTETEISYRVFVHLRDSQGAAVTQADGAPARWTRPTTGWLPGEYILDGYTLTMPPDLAAGVYDLYVGLYDPADGQRLGETWLEHLEITRP